MEICMQLNDRNCQFKDLNKSVLRPGVAQTQAEAASRLCSVQHMQFK